MAVRDDFAAGEVLAAADLNDTFASKLDAGAGQILQVVQAIYSTLASSSSSTYADTGLTATITPSSATSKVLVMVTHGGVAKTSGNTGVNFKLFRGATDLGVFDDAAGYNATSTTQHVGGVAFNYLDSPATTSATTYKTQFASGANIPTAWINNGGKASMTLLEISA